MARQFNSPEINTFKFIYKPEQERYNVQRSKNYVNWFFLEAVHLIVVYCPLDPTVPSTKDCNPM